MDTGVMSGAPSPNNYEVRCNALEEGKASPASPVAGIAMTVESDSGMIRRWLLGSYLVVAAAILITCYYFHLFAATSDLGTPSPLHCRSTFFRYNTAIGGSSCGLWGEECLPSTWMPIRCPALCGYSLHDALDTRVIGSSTYRADSRICLAAWHAGFIGAGGGCVDVRVAEGKEEYVKEQRNGIDGLAFDGSIFVVEMNHIEIYRGPARSLRFQPNATRFGVAKNATHLGVAKNATDEERHVYVRVAQIGQGLSRRVISATQVLALRYESSQPLTWPYALSLDDCTKATAIAQQPEWTLEGYV